MRRHCATGRSPRDWSRCTGMGHLRRRLRGFLLRAWSRSVWSAWSLLPLSMIHRVRQREQAPRTPNAPRGSVAALQRGDVRRSMTDGLLRSGLLGLCLVFWLAANAAEPWTLERSLDYALAHNPDARIAQHRIAAAEAGLEQANSAFWPRLRVESSYTRTDNPMLAFGNILNQRSYSSSLNFNAVPDVDDLNAPG